MAHQSESELAAINNELVLHGKWLKRTGGRRADLSFKDLSGLTLRKLRLEGAKLTGANLSHANLSESDLAGADLFGADLEAADLTAANLTGADFRGANLHKAVLSHCILRGADFRVGRAAGGGADSVTRLTEAQMNHAVLCEANLSGCDLSGSDLMDADFAGADLSRAVLVGAELSGATLDNVKFGDTVLDVSRLSPAQFAKVAAQGGTVEPTYRVLAQDELKALVESHGRWMASDGRQGKRLDLEEVRLSGAALAGRDLSGARLRRCALNEVSLAGTRIDMGDLSYCDLRGAVLEEASLRGTNLRRANLTRAHLAGACLDAMALGGGRMWPANLDGAILHDADLTNSSLSGAVMTNADVGGCILQGASLRGVDLGSVKRSPWSADGPGPKERRKMRRFPSPVLTATTTEGPFPTLDWSFGGLCLHWPAASQPKRGQTISIWLTAAGQTLPPVSVGMIVTANQPQRGTVSFRFLSLEDDLKAYLNGLLPAKYRKK